MPRDRNSAALSVTAAARERPRGLALAAGGTSFTWAELAARVAAASEAVRALALPPAARVAVVATARAETLVTVLALVELGVPFVPLHPRWTAAERAAVAADAQVAVVLDDGALPVREGARRGGPRRVAVGVHPAATLAIVYTSGTTGRPRGAVLSRRAFLASAAASAANLGWRARDRWLLAMPLAHVGGLSVLTRCLIARRCVVLHPRFEPDAVLDAIARGRVTLLSVVPSMLRRLLDADRGNVLARLRAMLVGGAAVRFEWLEECARRGVPALATYGLTEACSQVTAQRPRRPLVAERGCGVALTGLRVEVVDGAGRALPAGASGRIRVAGNTLMDGYLGGPRLGPEGFDTGDLGTLDARGTLTVHGRRTDLIVTGGENVYPAEVEAALEGCAGVARALVFGVADELWGQLVCAAIEHDGSGRFDEGRARQDLAGALAGYKLPRRLCVLDALPVSDAGKVLREGAAERFSPRLRAWGP